jgi:NADH dehydrogenase
VEAVCILQPGWANTNYGVATGIEFSAELYDLVTEDMARLYPDLIKYFKITVYDVAPKILSMFDEKLSKYAMEHLKREDIHIRTSHHVKNLRIGPPASSNRQTSGDPTEKSCYTLETTEEGEVGIGMCVWSTGLMMNPFVQKQSEVIHGIPHKGVVFSNVDLRDTDELDWILKKHPKTGAMITNDQLRLILEPKGQISSSDENTKTPRATPKNVFVLGDCATQENTEFPATAQVASQQAEWLAKRLNKGDLDTSSFKFRNLGVMAYLGNWNAAFQPGQGGDISGWLAWVIWRGAYLTKSVSLRNKILIPTYCEY